jgi:hypothetical protein
MKVKKKCKFADISTNLAFKIIISKPNLIMIFVSVVMKIEKLLILFLIIIIIVFSVLLLCLRAENYS